MKVQELTALTLGIRKPARTFPEASVALETASHGPPPQVKRVIKGKARPSRVQLPAISWPLLRLFTWYSGKYLQKHFHAVRLSRAGFPPKVGDAPLVIYSNHASWWDPLLGLVLRQKCFPNRSLYAPMDTKMLRRYGFFRRLGFFGVEPETRRGAVQFLSTAETLLAAPQTILAVTPQGRFVDVRERPIRFAPGLGHLAARVEKAWFAPLAVEYVFWEERLPEILVRFGPPVEVHAGELHSKNGDFWTRCFEQALERAQEALRSEACHRRADDFVTVLHGGGGTAVAYDLWRRLKAWWSGEPFKKEHGIK